MKKKLGLMFLLVLAAIVASYAQTNHVPQYAVSEMALTSFEKLVVNANIDVVLVQNDTLKKAYVEGDEQLVPGISITVVDGTLTIGSPKKMSYRGKVQVTIAVKELSKLEVNADAGVVTFEPLHAEKLAVSVNGVCDLHLKSTGKIFLATGDEYFIRYKNTSSKEAYVVVAEGSEG